MMYLNELVLRMSIAFIRTIDANKGIAVVQKEYGMDIEFHDNKQYPESLQT